MNRGLCILLLFAAALVAAHGVAAGATAMAGLDAMRRRVEEDTLMGTFEDEEAAAYPKRRVLQSGGFISYGGLAASKAACYGPCPARGQPYTGRGCQQIYQCRG